MSTRSLLAFALFCCMYPLCAISQSDPCALLDQADSLYLDQGFFSGAADSYHQAFYAAIERQKTGTFPRNPFSNTPFVTDDLGDNQGALDTLQRWTPFLEKQTGTDRFREARLYLAVSFNEAKLENNQGNWRPWRRPSTFSKASTPCMSTWLMLTRTPARSWRCA